MFKSYFIIILINIICVRCDDIFESNIGEDMKIGLASGGYKSVQLKCGSNSMVINVQTEDDFDGVLYTRGSFHDKKKPCFIDPADQKQSKHLQIKFNMDECKTKKKGDVYSNVLILQHDKELIMPGDAAFNLECDFSTPRDVTVNANLNSGNTPVVTRISLTDADPSNRNKKSTPTFESQTIVEITPSKVKRHVMNKVEFIT